MEQSQKDDFQPSTHTKLNPLLTMSKDELLALNGTQYKNLTQLPMNSLQESEKFCVNMVEIIEGHLLKDHRLLASLVNNLDPELKNVILASLKRIYNNNKIKLSIIECLDDPNTESFRQLFVEVYEMVFDTKEVGLLLNYLMNLSYLNRVNPTTVELKDLLFKETLELLSDKQIIEFYGYLVNLNVMPGNKSLLRALQQKLMDSGTELERYVVRTGKLNAKWHHLQDPIITDSEKRKMLHFFSFDLLKLFAFQATKRKDIIDSNLYLDLLVSKFELNCSEIENSVFVIENSEAKISGQVQEILRVVLFHLLTFKGPEQCIKILNYMTKNGLTIKYEMILTMMKNLRQQGYYDEAIVLINHFKLNSLSNGEKFYLVIELFSLMCKKFHNSPKIILGYLVMFRNHEKIITLLNEAGVLGLIYNQTPQEIKSPAILSANVDKQLTGVKFTHRNLAELYQVVFDQVKLQPDTIQTLFTQYLSLMQNQQIGLQMSDEIFTLCLNHLLKASPNDHSLMKLKKSRNNYDIAKDLAIKFYSQKGLVKLKPYPFDLLIYSGLLDHNDYTFASQLIKTKESLKLPFTFNQIYPFIIYCYENKQYDQAKLWYNVLVSHGIKSTNDQAKSVYNIARELQWDVSGFMYRKSIINRNYAKREALMNLSHDKVTFLGINSDDDHHRSSLHDDLIVALQKPVNR